MGWKKLLVLAITGFAIKKMINNDTVEESEDEFDSSTHSGLYDRLRSIYGIDSDDSQTNNASSVSVSEAQQEKPVCSFDGLLTFEEFKALAEGAARKIERIVSITVDGSEIKGTVESVSGLSTWSFEADYNDNGQITGEYSLWRGNYDSIIPEAYCKRLQNAINLFLNNSNYDENDKFVNTQLISFIGGSPAERQKLTEIFEEGLIEYRENLHRKAVEASIAAELARREQERIERLIEEKKTRERIEKQRKQQRRKARWLWIRKHWLSLSMAFLIILLLLVCLYIVVEFTDILSSADSLKSLLL